MSYKTELQSNNVDLQGILDKVNALPEMEEAPELPTLSNPAAAAQILSGYEVLDQHGIKLTGIMEDNGAVSGAVNAGGSYTIPAGYHNGSGKVTGNSLASQTSATAAAGDIASGKTAWVNGSKVTGTLSVGEKQFKLSNAHFTNMNNIQYFGYTNTSTAPTEYTLNNWGSGFESDKVYMLWHESCGILTVFRSYTSSGYVRGVFRLVNNNSQINPGYFKYTEIIVYEMI